MTTDSEKTKVPAGSLHPDRQAALEAHHAALLAWNKASSGTDAAAFVKADKKLNTARSWLVEMEIAHPTPAEVRRRNQSRKLSDRGLFD